MLVRYWYPKELTLTVFELLDALQTVKEITWQIDIEVATEHTQLPKKLKLEKNCACCACCILKLLSYKNYDRDRRVNAFHAFHLQFNDLGWHFFDYSITTQKKNLIHYYAPDIKQLH